MVGRMRAIHDSRQWQGAARRVQYAYLRARYTPEDEQEPARTMSATVARPVYLVELRPCFTVGVVLQ